jgi:DnaJ like chaperone protein
MNNHFFLLKSDPSWVFLFIIILLFFSPFLFVLSIFIRSKLNKSKYIQEFIQLAAFIMKEGDDVSSKEIRYVHYFLEKQFGKRNLESRKIALNNFLKSEKSVYHTLKNIDQNQDPKTKNQLLHFLVKIAIIDGYLKKKELLALEKVCKGIGLYPGKLISILALHSYITEQAHKQQSRNKKNYSGGGSTSKLKTAYKVLGLKDTATSKEIKKAYRKLVTLHHPDKLLNFSKAKQEESKRLYLKINDAYDLIKKQKGFK